MALFDDAARKRIEETIVEIELRTAAELVVVAVERSDTYADVRFVFALFCALLSGVVAHTFGPDLSVAKILWVEEAFAVFGFLISGVPAVLRMLTPKARGQSSVERRARDAFLDHSVFATRDRNGVLIMLSELERRVVILGDKAIHERVQQAGWQAHVQHVVDSIHKGRAAEGVREVLLAIGEVLVTQFPRRPDDTNELPNTVTQN